MKDEKNSFVGKSASNTYHASVCQKNAHVINQNILGMRETQSGTDEQHEHTDGCVI